jgi:hypothetical protein
MIAQMPEDALPAWSHTIIPQATRTAACLSSSEDWSDCGLARVARESRRANRYSQEERVTSYQTPYAGCCAMSNVIGFFPVKHLGSGRYGLYLTESSLHSNAS